MNDDLFSKVIEKGLKEYRAQDDEIKKQEAQQAENKRRAQQQYQEAIEVIKTYVPPILQVLEEAKKHILVKSRIIYDEQIKSSRFWLEEDFDPSLHFTQVVEDPGRYPEDVDHFYHFTAYIQISVKGTPDISIDITKGKSRPWYIIHYGSDSPEYARTIDQVREELAKCLYKLAKAHPSLFS